MKEARALPLAGPLPVASSALFLVIRRGIPLALAALSVVLAAAHPGARGWWLLVGAAGLALAWPSFLRGQAYMNKRLSVARQDALWALVFRPLARFLGLEDVWILSYCAHNNQRVQESFAQHRARRALILLPHCIQMARCKADVLEDLQTCYDCGLCPVGDYMQGLLLNRWEGRISNRSHKAYREAREYRPDLIVAVSCTDRLLKGLVKLPEIPCYVIPLSLPHGMCVDTQFSTPLLFSAMEALVDPRRPASEVQPLRREGIA
ncbi:MAG TPA: DUF116 domain-containing protein [Geothrix sp.]|nr:DUF116 domain-containing protein [Geothrix sp.]